MTEEQKEILQTAIDEAYDQFVGCVADGRKMDEKKVRKLADGRLYTASQAKENGLIDEIGSREETLDDMRSKYHLTGVDLTPIIYDPELGMMDKLLYSVSQIGKSKSESDLAILNKMMEESQKTEVLYMAPVQN
jgi:protease-4